MWVGNFSIVLCNSYTLELLRSLLIDPRVYPYVIAFDSKMLALRQSRPIALNRLLNASARFNILSFCILDNQ